jgi:hypothetical protein
VDEALLAAGRLANPHGQAVFFGKIHVFHNAMQAVAHARFKLPRNLGTPVVAHLSRDLTGHVFTSPGPSPLSPIPHIGALPKGVLFAQVRILFAHNDLMGPA